MGAINALGILTYIVSFAKEIFIIFLIYKVIKVLNICIRKNEVPFLKSKDEEAEQRDEAQADIGNEDKNINNEEE